MKNAGVFFFASFVFPAHQYEKWLKSELKSLPIGIRKLKKSFLDNDLFGSRIKVDYVKSEIQGLKRIKSMGISLKKEDIEETVLKKSKDGFYSLTVSYKGELALDATVQDFLEYLGKLTRNKEGSFHVVFNKEKRAFDLKGYFEDEDSFGQHFEACVRMFQHAAHVQAKGMAGYCNDVKLNSESYKYLFDILPSKLTMKFFDFQNEDNRFLEVWNEDRIAQIKGEL